MTYIPAPGVVKVVQYFSCGDNSSAANIWHVHSDIPWTYELLNDLIDVFVAVENSDLTNLRSPDATTTGYRATDLTSLSGAMAFRATDIHSVGLAAGVPINSTFAVKLDTGLRGRGRNGRIFWVGLNEDAVDVAKVHSDYATSVINAVGALKDAIAAVSDWNLCVLHKERDKVPLNPYEFSNVVRIAYTDLAVDSQRDRLPGHKRRKVRTQP